MIYTRLYKVSAPDEWTEEFPGEFSRPRRNSDSATLKYHRPRQAGSSDRPEICRPGAIVTGRR